MNKTSPLNNQTAITVSCGGRLHMGFFDLHGGIGRKFGSIGLSLTEPGLKLTASLSEQINISGEPAVSAASLARAAKLAPLFLQNLKLPAGVNIHLEQHIPEHAGLGSGTQIALAIGTAIKRLHQVEISTAQIAAMAGRGSRSGIGIAAFDQGGLLIDGGRALTLPANGLAPTKIPPLIARYDFPADWRVLMIFDASQPGIHGEAELQAFKDLPQFPESLAAHLCRYVLMQAMPALVERDLTAFGNSIQVLQSHIGDYFAPAQGGRYASKLVGSVLQHLENSGVACFGQSSWGPTGFAVFENAAAVEQQLTALKLQFNDANLSWKICSALNHGAELS